MSVIIKGKAKIDRQFIYGILMARNDQLRFDVVTQKPLEIHIKRIAARVCHELQYLQRVRPADIDDYRDYLEEQYGNDMCKRILALQ